MAESVTEPRTTIDEYSNLLHNCCQQRTRGQDPFVMPYVSVSELGKYISKVENKNLSGLDGDGNQLFKLSLPYIIDLLTFIFNLCIEKNICPSQLKKINVKSAHKTNPTNYSFVKGSRKACAHLFKRLFGKVPTLSPFLVWV